MAEPADEADLSEMWTFVERVQASTGVEELQTVAHQGLLYLIPCDSVSFTWVTPGQVHATVHPAPERAVLDHYGPMLAQRWRENPLAEHFRRTADSRPLTWGDVTDLSVWREASFYRDFYAPLGVWDQLGIRIPSPPGVVGGLVLNSAKAFSARDRSMLGLVGGQIALRMHALGETDAVQHGSLGAGWSAIGVDHDHRIVAVAGTTATDAGCRVGQPLPTDLMPLVELDPTRPIGGPVPPTEPQHVETAVGPVTAFMVPGWPGPHTIFLRSDEVRERPPASNGALLLQRGLTPRQGDVALLLADGQSNQQIASELDIGVATVKKHCHQVFAALEVDNRTAAAAALVRLLG